MASEACALITPLNRHSETVAPRIDPNGKRYPIYTSWAKFHMDPHLHQRDVIFTSAGILSIASATSSPVPRTAYCLRLTAVSHTVDSPKPLVLFYSPTERVLCLDGININNMMELKINNMKTTFLVPD